MKEEYWTFQILQDWTILPFVCEHAYSSRLGINNHKGNSEIISAASLVYPGQRLSSINLGSSKNLGSSCPECYRHRAIGLQGHHPYCYNQKIYIYLLLFLMITQIFTTTLSNKLREKYYFSFSLNLQVNLINDRCVW